MSLPYTAIVAGSGFAGAVTARRLAEAGLHVLILEKRTHIAGNAYDYTDIMSGLTIHKYGPHIFHTNNTAVFEFLSRFTSWNNYEHRVLASIYGKYLPVPFNLESLEAVFEKDIAKQLEKKLFYSYGNEGAVSILELIRAEDEKLKMLGEYVYKNIFETYTVKQWDKPPESIDPATTSRVPVRLSRDCRYFTDRYQGLPENGYTALFESMLAHENITLQTGVDALSLVSFKDNKILYQGKPFDGIFVYTGEIEPLLDSIYGELPYRTLRFEFETHNKEFFQPCGTVNYTVDMPYTRITEFKHMTGETSCSTVILKEYSKAYIPHTDEIPYYPIIDEYSVLLYNKYREKLSSMKGLYLIGRLAEYKYYNMDAVCERAFTICEEILHNTKH